jgi:hypothetical protein
MTSISSPKSFEGGTTLADNMLGIAAVLKASVALDAMLSELSATSAGGLARLFPIPRREVDEAGFSAARRGL